MRLWGWAQSGSAISGLGTHSARAASDFKVTDGNFKTSPSNDPASAVKIDKKLDLSLAYSVMHNTSPAPDPYATDTLITVNLVEHPA